MTAAPPVRPGDVLAAKYRVERVLGAGGMGVVVAAHHLHLDEKVAIKFLLPDALGSAEAVARFTREARAAVKIKSEHVARVIDVGVLDSGAPYMVMEYLEGGDLAAWINQSGPLPIEQATDFVAQACEAIAEAHRLGIVHRDLKPANLFIVRTSDGLLSAKVLDFGISKVGGLAPSHPEMGMTRTNSVMGSPLYMSPEQMHSAKDADTRADIWALGAILYELLLGEPPFLAESMPELILKVVSSPAPALRTRRKDVPAGLETVVLRCLEKDRSRRYANVAELAQALAVFGSKRAIASAEKAARILGMTGVPAVSEPPASLLPSSEQPPSGTLAPWGQTAKSKVRGTNAIVLALGGIVIALLAVVGFLLMRHTEVTPSGSAPLTASGVQDTGATLTPNAAPRREELAPVVSPTPSVAIPYPSTAKSTSAELGAKTQSSGRKVHRAAPVSAAQRPTSPPAPTSRPSDEGVFDDRQ